ncbi:MAG: hypothetical protein LQ338_001530 [Usnochroma carphineum]|nr:MAG: hypothetical protein LQ338_001530 [Usnochroma carphineum]
MAAGAQVLFRSQSFEQSAQRQHQDQLALESHGKSLAIQGGFEQTSALLLGLNLEQRQLFQTLIESNRQLVHANERIAYELEQMRSAVQLHLELPPQVFLQKPVTILDACGKVSAFHLEFINCAEAFLAVMKIRFQQYGVSLRGIKMLDESCFILQDHKRTLDLSKPWSQVLRPSQKLNMSMLFHRNSPLSVCPACQSESLGTLEPPFEWVQEALPSDASAGSDLDVYSRTKAARLATGMYDDIVDQFRRVQLVEFDYEKSSPPENPSLSSKAKRPGRPLRSRSPFHLFDMSAALLNMVESNHDNSAD